ncbi:MAG: hypothetical protein ACI9U2_004641 [Bradymonadia bacterium]|jgi:hypothetical protein
MRRVLWMALLSIGVVAPVCAQTWVVIRPSALDAGSAPLARALGDAIDRSLSRRRGARRAGNLLEPAETLTVLDCLQLNDNCANRAARAVDADGAIYATVQRAGTRVLVEASRTTGAQRRRLAWRIEMGEQRLDGRVADRLADALGAEIVADGAVVRTGLFSADRRTISLDGFALTLDGLAPIEPGTHAVQADGTQQRINLLPGEIVVLAESVRARRSFDAPRPGRDYDLATPGWLLVVGGSVSLLAAGAVRGVHSGTVDAYANAQTGAKLRAADATARSEATAMNVLLVAGGVALVAGVALLLFD